MRKNVIFCLIVIAGIALFIPTCTEAPFKPSIGQFEFPLAVGNSWQYQYNNVRYYLDSINVDSITGVDTITGDGDARIIEKSAPTELAPPIFTFESEYQIGSSSGSETEYYSNLPQGFCYLGGNASVWTGPPKLVPGDNRVQFAGVEAGSMEELLAKLTNPSRIDASSLALGSDESHPIPEWGYPLEIGNRWVYRDTVYGDIWRMDKMVVGIQDVTVPAGTFKCYVLQWFWDMDLDGNWEEDIEGYDYVAPIGTVKRVFKIYGVQNSGYEMSQGGTYNSITSYALTEYNVANAMQP